MRVGRLVIVHGMRPRTDCNIEVGASNKCIETKMTSIGEDWVKTISDSGLLIQASSLQ